PSASVISNDPSILFNIAGMVQFIPYLSGDVPAPYPRATSVQKCVRTADIEEVGKTTRHGTFFQMNGVRSKTDFDIKGELPAKNIDTGMGLERVAFLKQGVENMYEVDEVFPVIKAAADMAGISYGDDEEDDVRLRVVADHVR
ncbi:alanine--tRNA ligase-related protein, partial [Brevibacterium paucivorans]